MKFTRILRRASPAFALAVTGAFALGVLSGDPTTTAAMNAVLVGTGVGFGVGLVNVVKGQTN